MKASARLLRQCVGRPILHANEWVWNHGLGRFAGLAPVHGYATFFNALVLKHSLRQPLFGTTFLRNRPQLELISRCAGKKARGAVLRIAVMACSKGAEVYSVQWKIRSARPDLQVVMQTMDISSEVMEFARRGVYSLTADEYTEVPVFERVTEEEMRRMFVRDGSFATVQSWLREGITWRAGDAGDPGLAAEMGLQDIVIANNFLCHLSPRDAERCLRNVARLVVPGGCLFVCGVDLEVRTKVAREAGWHPIPDLLEEIHYGDHSPLGAWPWHYWGLEPLDKSRPDWQVRYCTAFRVGQTAGQGR
jgi:chemotaxis protein methyltransferase CheR